MELCCCLCSSSDLCLSSVCLHVPSWKVHLYVRCGEGKLCLSLVWDGDTRVGQRGFWDFVKDDRRDWSSLSLLWPAVGATTNTVLCYAQPPQNEISDLNVTPTVWPAPFFSTFPGVVGLFWLRLCFFVVGLKLQSITLFWAEGESKKEI